MSDPNDAGGWGSGPSGPPPSGPPGWGPSAPPQPGYPPPGAGPAPGYGPPPGAGPAPGASPGYGAPPGYQFAGYPQLATGMYLDPASGLMLPVGTELASAGRRIGAFFLAIPLSIVTLFIGYLVWGAIIWSRGQTPALQVLGMRCYRPETGKVAGWGWMALREIVGRLVDGILSIITYLVSFILFLSRRDRRSLHDLVAGTVVLRDPGKVLVRR